jgi:hypothetical protein
MSHLEEEAAEGGRHGRERALRVIHALHHPNVRRARIQRLTLWTTLIVLIVAVLPVPWMHAVGDDPPGWAWRMDGRLVVDGQVMDPAGKWSWLTVGRPPLLYELVLEAIQGTDSPARDMRVGSPGSRPAQSEPFAAAIGLREAGYDLPLGMFIEVAYPVNERLPDTAVITEIDGVPLITRDDLDASLPGLGEELSFTTASGETFTVEGAELPYGHVRVIDLAPQGLEAAIGGQWSRLAPVAWFRSLSLGSSNGMMVALLTYAHVADPDLARGRHIAGTGGIAFDGRITRIGGLPTKAQAARRAGADVLLFPASQERELMDFDAGGMRLVPVETLAEAITYLQSVRLAAPEDDTDPEDPARDGETAETRSE